MRLVLFDIDGTLITTQNAGMRAFYRAMDTCFGINIETDVIHPDGMTDPLILKELLQIYNLGEHWSDENRERVLSAYLCYLDEEINRAKELGWIRILPGVRNLLEILSRQTDLLLGLVTGNLEAGARIKLKYARLDWYFHFGGYGSDSEDRTILTRIGIKRGTQLVAPKPIDKVFVIGDTPKDILHGQAAGASVIAVASARYNLDELAAHTPDMLVSNLVESEAILHFLRYSM